VYNYSNESDDENDDTLCGAAMRGFQTRFSYPRITRKCNPQINRHTEYGVLSVSWVHWRLVVIALVDSLQNSGTFKVELLNQFPHDARLCGALIVRSDC
jgi:hypothetical protein